MSSAFPISDNYISLIRRFPLRRLTTDRHFEEASSIMTELMRKGDESLTPDELDYLYVLSKLVADFEERHRQTIWTQLPPGKILRFLMVENGLTLGDLTSVVRHKSNLSAFLNGHRGLSRENASKLGTFFKVDPNVFLTYLSSTSKVDLRRTRKMLR